MHWKVLVLRQIILPSSLARSVLGGMRADWSPIARLELPIQFLLVHLLPHVSNVELLLPLTE